MFSDILDKEEDRMNLIRDMLKTLTKREENVLRRKSTNYPANTILTYFIYSESLSILPLSESKNETLHKYSYVILLFICFEFNDLMWVWTGG